MSRATIGHPAKWSAMKSGFHFPNTNNGNAVHANLLRLNPAPSPPSGLCAGSLTFPRERTKIRF